MSCPLLSLSTVVGNDIYVRTEDNYIRDIVTPSSNVGVGIKIAVIYLRFSISIYCTISIELRWDGMFECVMPWSKWKEAFAYEGYIWSTSVMSHSCCEPGQMISTSQST